MTRSQVGSIVGWWHAIVVTAKDFVEVLGVNHLEDTVCLGPPA